MMPLFKCSSCGAVENTALGNFWIPNVAGEPVECSECETGTWHGRFDKKDADKEGYVTGSDGFLYKPEEVAPGGYFERYGPGDVSDENP